MRQFITDAGASLPSFLKCLEQKKYCKDDINHKAVFEFLTFGSVYGTKTFINGIKKKVTHQPYRFRENEGFSKAEVDARNPLINSSPVDLDKALEKFLDFFGRRKKKLRKLKISIDLTGGIDSRLIASVFHHFDIPFNTVFSTVSGSSEELKIVEQLTDILGCNLKVISGGDGINSANEIRELFELGDGLWDPISLFSLTKSQQWRQQQKYDLAITGVGGELYKDFWWQQDFPFYRKESSNIDRLLKLRMYPVLLPEKWVDETLRKEYADFIPDFKIGLKTFEEKWNTQTYDQIYYHLRIKEQISVLSHASSTYLPVWSPLIESDLLSIGYNLRRRHRFFNRFHRHVITNIIPDISKIPTTDGQMSVSSDMIYVSRDLIKFVVSKTERVLKLFRNKSTIIEENDLNEEIKESTNQAIQKLKSFNILSNEAPDYAESYPQKIHGRLITLGLTFGKLN